MKQIFIFLVCMLLQIGAWAAISVPQTNVVNQQVQSEQISNFQPSLHDNILSSRIELLEKHEAWILTMFGFALTIVGVILGLLQWFFSLRAKEAVFKELAAIANQDKEAFKNSLKIKAIELDLINNYPIHIISDFQKENSKSKKLKELLIAYHFKQVKILTYEEAFDHKFCNKSVMVFCDDSFNEALCKSIIEKSSNTAVFGFGEREKLIIEKPDGLNYANSFASIYNNLMSLLHYKRYLNKNQS